jgi:hypothetical protein
VRDAPSGGPRFRLKAGSDTSVSSCAKEEHCIKGRAMQAR